MSRLGKKRFDRLTKELLSEYQRMRDFMVAELTADGPPPFTVELSPRALYDKLVAFKQSQDPRYWDDLAAQAELAALEGQFGPAMAVAPTPFPSNFPGVV